MIERTFSKELEEKNKKLNEIWEAGRGNSFLEWKQNLGNRSSFINYSLPINQRNGDKYSIFNSIALRNVLWLRKNFNRMFTKCRDLAFDKVQDSNFNQTLLHWKCFIRHHKCLWSHSNRYGIILIDCMICSSIQASLIDKKMKTKILKHEKVLKLLTVLLISKI